MDNLCFSGNDGTFFKSEDIFGQCESLKVDLRLKVRIGFRAFGLRQGPGECVISVKVLTKMEL